MKRNFRSKKSSLRLYQKKVSKIHFEQREIIKWKKKEYSFILHHLNQSWKVKMSSNTHNRQKGLIEFVKFQFNVSMASKQIELDHRFISDFFMHLLSIHRTILFNFLDQLDKKKFSSNLAFSFCLSLSFFPINHVS